MADDKTHAASKNHPRKSSWSRRKVLATLGIGGISAFSALKYFGRAAFEAVFGEGVVKVVANFAGSIGKRTLSDERYDLLSKSLSISRNCFDIIGADAHDTAIIRPQTGTYINEEKAADALLAACKAAPGIEVVPDVYRHNPTHSAICLGSSKASRAVMSLMGPVTAPRFRCRGPDYEAAFEYSIKKIPGKLIRIQENREHRTDRRTVVDRSLNLVTEIQVSGRTLVSDVLLVMRLPKQLAHGTDILIFAGVHGPALRAVELLVEKIDLRDLEKLVSFGRSHPYYQALFHVEGLTVKDGNTVADQISLMSDLLKPVAVRPL